MTHFSVKAFTTLATRWKDRSCNTRNIFAWVTRGISPISSRKNEPPWACSNLPRRRAKALVNEPFIHLTEHGVKVDGARRSADHRGGPNNPAAAECFNCMSNHSFGSFTDVLAEENKWTRSSN